MQTKLGCITKTQQHNFHLNNVLDLHFVGLSIYVLSFIKGSWCYQSYSLGNIKAAFTHALQS